MSCSYITYSQNNNFVKPLPFPTQPCPKEQSPQLQNTRATWASTALQFLCPYSQFLFHQTQQNPHPGNLQNFGQNKCIPLQRGMNALLDCPVLQNVTKHENCSSPPMFWLFNNCVQRKMLSNICDCFQGLMEGCHGLVAGPITRGGDRGRITCVQISRTCVYRQEDWSSTTSSLSISIIIPK